MKKSVLVVFSILFLFSVFPMIFADINNTQITNGFSCLSNKTTSCPSLSIGQQIFTSLASGQCTDWISNSSSSNGCYPSGSCDIKTTAQAVLALKNADLSTNQSVTWLLSQEQNTNNLNWYLEADSNQMTNCNVSYFNQTHSFTINSDKTISGNNLGTGLSVSSSYPYWFLISPSAYGTQFQISCNQSFTLTTLYQRQGYSTIYVSGSLDSSSPNGVLTDSVNSSCFSSGGVCSYEATLWATLALSSLNYDVSPFLPYITVLSGDSANQKYLPNAFLYALTSSNNYLQDLLGQQVTVNGKSYWQVSGDPYYDTSLALFTTSTQSSTEKNNAINWLMQVQSSDGCWNSDNILDTAFVLYSLAGTNSQSSGTSPTNATNTTTSGNCTSAGYYCISGTACNLAGGNVLSQYPCNFGISVCCSKPQTSLPSCSSQGGQTCSSGQTCTGGSVVGASDTSSCCLGTCANQQQTQTDCSLAGGTCRDSCFTNEQVSQTSCAPSSQVCCVANLQASKGNSAILIWILAILIVLLVLAIIFRKKLKMLWIKLKSKKGKGSQQAPPRGPPFSPPPFGFPRRPQPLPPQRPRPQSSEVSDVLKKLKDMGK